MAKKNDTIFFENKLLDFVTAKDPMFEMLQPFPLCQDRCPSVRQFAVIYSWLSDGYVPSGSHYLSFGHVPIANHKSVSFCIFSVEMLLDKLLDLVFQRCRNHFSCKFSILELKIIKDLTYLKNLPTLTAFYSSFPSFKIN